MSAPIVIVGGGMAAGTAVVELRETGYDGELVVFADEPHPPYERPPLSKAYLAGTAEAESAYLKPAQWYAEHDVDLRTGTPVTRLDPVGHAVHAGEAAQTYSRLLIATGARARTTDLEPTREVGVGYLRSLGDAHRLRSRVTPDTRLLVVGAGWIGMEVAATARGLGAEVTVVEPADQPLLRALGPELGGRLADVHRRHGVDLRTSTSLAGLSGHSAHLSDGTELDVDTVLVGIGAVPNDTLAREAGLDVADGILVSAGLATSSPDVFAAGDVASHAHPLLAERVRVEHWQNAVGQGRAAAHALLGEPVVYDDLPMFFSDQYDLGLEYFGHPGAAGFDDLRIDPVPDAGPDALTARWYRQGRVVAAMHINDWDRSAELARLVRDGR